MTQGGKKERLAIQKPCIALQAQAKMAAGQYRNKMMHECGVKRVFPCAVSGVP